MKLLFALVVTNDDAASAEKFLDFVRTYSGKRGHLLLAILSDVHDEMKARIRVSATLAFDVVHEMTVNPLADRNAPASAQSNNHFRQVARHVSESFHWPFLWLTSNCTPTSPQWRQRIVEQYENQPCLFFGNRMRWKPKGPDAKDVFFMARVGIYPPNTSSIMLSPADSPVPIEIASAATVIGRLGATKAFQQANIADEGDLLSVREDALLVSGDTNGLLRAQVVLKGEKPEPIRIQVDEQKPDPLIEKLTPALTLDTSRSITTRKNGARR